MCAWRVVAEADRNVEEPSHKLHQGRERFSMYCTWSASLDCCIMCTMDLEPVSEWKGNWKDVTDKYAEIINDVQFLRRSFWNQQQLIDELSREKARELLNLLYAPGFRLSAKNPPMMKQQQRRRRSNKGRWTPYMLELPAIIEQQSCGEWCNCDNSY